MKIQLFNSLVILALWGSLAQTAVAQTARIAHLSHSGSMATLEAAADNFGIPPSHFEADSIEILTDSTAREYGRWTGYHKAGKTNVVQFGYAKHGYGKSVRQYITSKQQYHPHLKVIRRDSVAAKEAPKLTTPVLEKQKVKRKKSALLPTTVPAPPQHPGVALAIAAILVLAGAGWLLGERKPTSNYPV
ncbi:hypothetical protein Q5H92_16640 [Hymenobacter sp. M29]|uniref:Uncharacterized protein n=1 Tax=Hymenobacter mellowenesis TaxID=3063995 RepID=A0ABT9ADR7_9BACT|nr:hypothetical protein [Hymenobacter sp. M29]MDO7847995.1 hypothetical protein [Hymenobacter sp. M29]